MKVTTTFWTDDIYEFTELLYINGRTKEVIFRTNLCDRFETYKFFKAVSKFVKSSTCIDSYNTKQWYQFAVVRDFEVEHIKWFDLVINDTMTISHDIAFETTMIVKNGIAVPLGKFPMWADKEQPKYREFNLKARAYKYIANQVWSRK